MYSTDSEGIKDIIRHELAHMMTFVCYGKELMPHGPEFREVCERYGWNSEVKRASSDLSEQKEEFGKLDIRSERIINKIQKLLS